MNYISKKYGYLLGGAFVVFVGVGGIIDAYFGIFNLGKQIVPNEEEANSTKSDSKKLSSYAVLPYMSLENCTKLVKDVLEENSYQILSYNSKIRKFIFREQPDKESEARCVGHKKANYSYAFILSYDKNLHSKIGASLELQRTIDKPSNYDYKIPQIHNSTYLITTSKPAETRFC